MAEFVIALYRPLPGKAAELLELVRQHHPTLLGQGLVTDRPPYLLRASDGSLLEVFEWVSAEAADAAHDDPVVMALWDRFGVACEFGKLADLAESELIFPHFVPVDL